MRFTVPKVLDNFFGSFPLEFEISNDLTLSFLDDLDELWLLEVQSQVLLDLLSLDLKGFGSELLELPAGSVVGISDVALGNPV